MVFQQVKCQGTFEGGLFTNHAGSGPLADFTILTGGPGQFQFTAGIQCVVDQPQFSPFPPLGAGSFEGGFLQTDHPPAKIAGIISSNPHGKEDQIVTRLFFHQPT